MYDTKKKTNMSFKTVTSSIILTSLPVTKPKIRMSLLNLIHILLVSSFINIYTVWGIKSIIGNDLGKGGTLNYRDQNPRHPKIRVLM